MALLSVIRRWHFREGMPIREIERRTGLSRNTIRKYLRSGTVEPRFKVPDRPSKLDPFAEKLAGWLRIEAGRSRKQRRTVKQWRLSIPDPVQASSRLHETIAQTQGTEPLASKMAQAEPSDPAAKP